MDSSANVSKGERSWSAWNQASTFYDDTARAAMQAEDARLTNQIQDWIKDTVKAR